MSAVQRLKRDRVRKKLTTILSRCDKIELLQTLWLFDRAWSDPTATNPSGYDYPREFFEADIASVHRIYGWETETLLTELLRVKRRDGRRQVDTRRWAFASTVINTLRAVENEDDVLDAASIHRRLSMIGYRQFRWQSNSWKAIDLLRWWIMFSDPALAAAYERVTGLNVSKFILLALMWSQTFNTHWSTLRLEAGEMTNVTEEELAKTQELLVASIEELEKDARSAAATSDSIAYRRGILRQRPIISFQRRGQHLYTRPMETVMNWRISSGLYYDVIGDREVTDKNLIGVTFEGYVRRAISEKFSGWSVKGDLRYGPKAHVKLSPDALVIRDGMVSYVIECKVAKLPLRVQTSADDSKERDRVIRDVGKGVKQICEFISLLQAGIPELGLRAAKTIVPIVVTLDDWLFFSRDKRCDVLQSGRQQLEEAGLSHALAHVDQVILCSASELDHLLSVYAVDVIPSVLAESMSPAHVGSPLGAFICHSTAPKMEDRRHPLASRIDELLNPELLLSAPVL